MAISVGAGSGKGVAPQMNVTPLVDVVLVLLIIFLVITPLMSKDFWVHLPKQEKEEVTPEQLQQDPEPPLVLHVGANRSIQVNGVDLQFDEVAGRLARMFAARDDHILFFEAADDAEYGFAVQVLDQARQGGAVSIAPLTHPLTQASASQAGSPAADAAGADPAPVESQSAPAN